MFSWVRLKFGHFFIFFSSVEFAHKFSLFLRICVEKCLEKNHEILFSVCLVSKTQNNTRTEGGRKLQFLKASFLTQIVRPDEDTYVTLLNLQHLRRAYRVLKVFTFPSYFNKTENKYKKILIWNKEQVKWAEWKSRGAHSNLFRLLTALVLKKNESLKSLIY